MERKKIYISPKLTTVGCFVKRAVLVGSFLDGSNEGYSSIDGIWGAGSNGSSEGYGEEPGRWN